MTFNTKLPKDYFSAEYRDFCSQHSKYPYPEDKWKGGVVLALVEDNIILLKRSLTMPTHKGQVGLPGGTRHPGENDPVVTAFREWTEETGIKREDLEFMGILPPTYANFNYILIPIVARCRISEKKFKEKMILQSEWSHLFSVSIKHLSQPDLWNYGQRLGLINENAILYFPIDRNKLELFHAPRVDSREPMMLWGATGRIVWNLLSFYHA